MPSLLALGSPGVLFRSSPLVLHFQGDSFFEAAVFHFIDPPQA